MLLVAIAPLTTDAAPVVSAMSSAVGADSPQRWDPCPAADTVPVCEIVRTPGRSGSDGSEVAVRPAPADRSAVWTGDAKDHPGYGPVNPPDIHTEWVGSVGVGCRRVPWPQVIACPGITGTTERIDIPDCVVVQWHPFIFCPN
jgi:hypothetical protein